MALHPTTAAQVLQRQGKVDSHTLISLLMDGGLERIAQAKDTIVAGDEVALTPVLEKIVSIIDGLRSFLNLDEGGEIAENLDALYDYMISRMCQVGPDEQLAAVNEVGELLQEIKAGWDSIEAG